MKIMDAKATVDKAWEKLARLSAWQVTKVKSKKEVIEQAQMEERTVHFATLICATSRTRSGTYSSRNIKAVWYSEVMLCWTTLAHTLYSRSKDRQHRN